MRSAAWWLRRVAGRSGGSPRAADRRSSAPGAPEHTTLERQLAGLFDHIPAGLSLRDLDGRYLHANAHLAQIYGRTPQEMIGLDPAEVHPDPAVRERVRAEDARILATGEAEVGEFAVQQADGLHHYHAIRYPVLDRGGRPIGFGSFSMDVTETRAVERRGREAAEQFRSAMEHAPIGMAVVSPDGRWLKVNRALCDLVGYTEPELLQMSFRDVTHPDDLDSDLDSIRRMLAGRTAAHRAEKRYRHRNGRQLWVEISVTLVRDDQDRPLHFITQTEDITREREAREALAESERRYQSIAANVPGMVYRFAQSPEGEQSLSFVSAGARDIYELEPEEIVADPTVIFARIHPEDQPQVFASIAESATELTRWEWNCRHIFDGDRVKFLRAVAQPFREADGTVVWDGVIVDETEMHVARAEETETRQRLQTILENLAGSAITIYDREHRLRMCEGPAFGDLDANPLIGQPLRELASPGVVGQIETAIEQAFAGEPSTTVIESDRDEERRVFAVRTVPYRMADGTIDGALVHWHDITSVRQAEQARDEAQDRFRIAFERAPIGMMLVGLDGRFERVNDAICEITGRTAPELTALEPFELMHPDEVETVRDEFARVGTAGDTITFENRIAHASGEYRWVQARVTVIRDHDGRPLHALAQILDVTERRADEQRLQHLADHDTLTGLLNRRGFETALRSHLNRCRRYGATGTLLMLDLDGFKSVNDSLGHAAGDALLGACAHVLVSRLRNTDVVARLGGDEFAIVLPYTRPDSAVRVAEQLLDSIRSEACVETPEGSRGVTGSIGIAPFTEPPLTSDEILTRADAAMYEAKQAGKGRYVVAESTVAEFEPSRRAD